MNGSEERYADAALLSLHKLRDALIARDAPASAEMVEQISDALEAFARAALREPVQ